MQDQGLRTRHNTMEAVATLPVIGLMFIDSFLMSHINIPTLRPRRLPQTTWPDPSWSLSGEHARACLHPARAVCKQKQRDELENNVRHG